MKHSFVTAISCLFECLVFKWYFVSFCFYFICSYLLCQFFPTFCSISGFYSHTAIFCYRRILSENLWLYFVISGWKKTSLFWSPKCQLSNSWNLWKCFFAWPKRLHTWEEVQHFEYKIIITIKILDIFYGRSRKAIQ